MEIPAASKVSIQIHCPQCRGDIEFLEEAHVIRCRFCGVELLVAGREGVLRYVLSPQISDAQKAKLAAVEHLRKEGKRAPRAGEAFLFYAPFWRMQGTVYRWVFGLKPMKIEIPAAVPQPMERYKTFFVRLMDHSVPAYSDLEIGLYSLGVRPQALRLRPFSPEHLEMRDSFLPLDLSLEGIQGEAERFSELFFQAENLISEVNLQRFIGLTFSVIYFPLWYVECSHQGGREIILLDAVGRSPVQALPDGSPILARLRGNETRKTFQFSELRFLPFRCPNCGWAFPFLPLSILHFCPTCRRLFREKGGEWTELEYSVVPPPGERPPKNLLWVPFWRFRVGIAFSGQRLETMADLYRLAPPPRVFKPEYESRRPIYFYVPAVRFRNPQTLHNLASRLTYLQPEIQLGSFEDGSHPFAAGGSLEVKDAREMGILVLGARIPQSSTKARAWIKDCRVEFQDSRVVFFPFTQADLFWKEMTTGVSFQRNDLSESLPENRP